MNTQEQFNDVREKRMLCKELHLLDIELPMHKIDLESFKEKLKEVDLFREKYSKYSQKLISEFLDHATLFVNGSYTIGYDNTIDYGYRISLYFMKYDILRWKLITTIDLNYIETNYREIYHADFFDPENTETNLDVYQIMFLLIKYNEDRERLLFIINLYKDKLKDEGYYMNNKCYYSLCTTAKILEIIMSSPHKYNDVIFKFSTEIFVQLMCKYELIRYGNDTIKIAKKIIKCLTAKLRIKSKKILVSVGFDISNTWYAITNKLENYKPSFYSKHSFDQVVTAIIKYLDTYQTGWYTLKCIISLISILHETYDTQVVLQKFKSGF